MNELLRKYMALVLAEEGTTFLDCLHTDGTSVAYRDPPFTPDEIAELERIETELRPPTEDPDA